MKLRALVSAATLTSLALVGCNTGKSNPSPKQVASVLSSGFVSSATLGGGINAVGSFSAGAGMSQGARAGHTATWLDQAGRVLVVGGQKQPGAGAATFQQENELYDPTANTWTVISQVSATPNDGRLMDPTNTFATGRIYHAAVKAPSGVVVICGGLGFERLVNNNPVIEALETTYTYDPNAVKFNPVTKMPVRRYFHLASLTSNNLILVACGWDKFDQQPKLSLQSADLFDPGAGTWTSITGGVNALAAGHTWGNMLRYGQNTLIMNGGKFDNAASQQPPPTLINIGGITPQAVMIGSTNSTGKFSSGGEVFTASSSTFGTGPAGTRITSPRGILLSAGHTLPSTNVIVFAGGEDLGPQMIARYSNLYKTELLDLVTNQFVAGPDLNSSAPLAQGQTTPAQIGVSELQALEIGSSGDVLIMAGVAVDPTAGGQPAPTTQCEIMDTLNKKMKSLVQMQTARFDFQAVKTTGNQIVVIGGRTDLMNTPTDSVELYNR
ncbi:MAG: kelch repeat-containing protein [Planctomycetota bacterium]